MSINKEEITIGFKDQTGFRISECDIATGKVVVNGIEITSVEDWEKVTKSLVDLQQENKQLKEKYKNIIDRYKFIKNRVNQGMSIENKNKCLIELGNNILQELD